MLFLKNDSCIYCTTIKVETPYSGKRKCPPASQTDIFIKSSYDPSDEHRKEQQKLTHAEQDEIHNYEEIFVVKTKQEQPHSETVRGGRCAAVLINSLIFTSYFPRASARLSK